MENSDQLPYVYHGKVTLPSEKESINFKNLSSPVTVLKIVNSKSHFIVFLFL